MSEEQARYEIKDSGQRQEFAGGMVRDTTEDKTLWHLVADGPILQRWAEHLTKGARKYSARNWMLASGQEEYERFRESAFRHFMQWWAGDRDEDHAAAVVFNLNGAEYIRDRLPKKEFDPQSEKRDDFPGVYVVGGTDVSYRCPLGCSGVHAPCTDEQCFCDFSGPA